MPFIDIGESPSLPGIKPVTLHYRETGNGPALLFLHGGWGYEPYPFDNQIDAFGDRFRILIPDRSGYGRSAKMTDLPIDFHQRAVVEMMNFLNALEIKRAVLWGHSDGAVIAAMMGLSAPERFMGLILEAFHFYPKKKESRAFFAAASSDPDRLAKQLCEKVKPDYGEDYWRRIVRSNANVWLRLNDENQNPHDDLYQGRLAKLLVPTVFLHGKGDPRTEPGEIAAVRTVLPHVPFHVIDEARHSPHSESGAYARANQLADAFLHDISKEKLL
jgi:pimeloyl-ACP methyl ester carboxylesterase